MPSLKVLTKKEFIKRFHSILKDKYEVVIKSLKNEGIAIAQTKYGHIAFDEDKVEKILSNKKQTL